MPSFLEVRDITRPIDPLSEVTRRERKYLLGLSAVTLFIAQTGRGPGEFTLLGLSFKLADLTPFLPLLASVVTFFLVAFILYGLGDYLKWRIEEAMYPPKEVELHTTNKGVPPSRSDEFLQIQERRYASVGKLGRKLQFAVIGRGLFEYYAPIGIALWAIIAAFSWTSTTA